MTVTDEYTVLAPSEACREIGHGLAWMEVSVGGDRLEICADCSIAWRLAHRAGSEDFADRFVDEVRRNEPLENLDDEAITE